MSRKVFTAGEVLAAADVNSFLMDQTVMSFAGTAARGSAIPSPVAGMTTYLEDSDDLQIYNGTSYASPFGLTLVKKQAIGTGASVITVTNAFSSTYDAYKIIVAGGVGSTDGFLITQLTGATTQYYQTRILYNYVGTVNVGADNNTSAWTVGGRFVSQMINVNFDLVNPFLTQSTMLQNASDVSNLAAGVNSGVQLSNTSFTGFTMTTNTGTLTGGNLYVYGYRKN
jgi:hypothetical protein